MGRAPCCDKANVKRGPWSPEEDAALKSYIEKHGTGGNWIALPQKAGLRRCGKSCRLRWLNYLRPDIKHGGFTEEEDNIICTLYDRIGSRWSVIASHLAGRTDNDVKNYWNTKLKKKLMARQAKSIHSPAPTPPTPILPAVKTEALSSVDFNFSIPLLPNYGQSQKLYSDAMPFSMMSLIEQPDFNANGRVVSPSEEFSAASSSMTVENSSSSNSYFNWPCSTRVGPNDLFLSAVGFGDINGDFFSSYGYQLENLGEVTPCYISNPPIMWPAPETKAEGLQQSLTYS